MLKHIHEEPPKLTNLPLSLIKLVDECLKKLPADRPDSMDAVLLPHSPGAVVGTGGWVENGPNRLPIHHVLPILGPAELGEVSFRSRSGETSAAIVSR